MRAERNGRDMAASRVTKVLLYSLVVAAIGTVLAAGYLLWMLQKVAFGVPKPEFEDAHIHDVSSYEWTAWIPILVLILVLGVFPNIVFHVTDGAVTQLTDGIASVIK